jgi:branched-chain amino acid transport system permease protein
VLVGIPALRIRGLFLAVTTLSFAYAVNEVLFEEKYFGWLLPKNIERPTLFFLDFADQRSMYYLCIASLLLGAVIVTNLRRSRTGRILIASRDNEAAVQAFGVALVRTKLIAFAISGALAGLAGVVYAHQQLGVNAESFSAQKSVDVFLFAVLGGVTSVAGPILGSGAFNVLDYFFAGNPIVQFMQPFSVLIVLYVAPGGLASLLTRVRDEWLRVIAQRRQIVVPSLFADYDADALERRLVPLRPVDDRQVTDTHFALSSVLYRTGENDDDLLITDVVRSGASDAPAGVDR